MIRKCAWVWVCARNTCMGNINTWQLNSSLRYIHVSVARWTMAVVNGYKSRLCILPKHAVLGHFSRVILGLRLVLNLFAAGIVDHFKFLGR